MIFYSPITCVANITRRKPNITAKQYHSPQANRVGVILRLEYHAHEAAPFVFFFSEEMYNYRVDILTEINHYRYSFEFLSATTLLAESFSTLDKLFGNVTNDAGRSKSIKKAYLSVRLPLLARQGSAYCNIFATFY